MVAFVGIFRTFSRMAKETVKTSRFRLIGKQCNYSRVEVGSGVKGLAVSDGELNMSTRGCAGSSSSLPGIQISPASQANSVLSWAVSFEKLLEDPTGVRYFTDFLNSEVSAENIMFWQACEEFQKIPATSSAKLKASACCIYQTYLAGSAPFAVNITDTAKNQTQDLESPTPDMFDKAQSQIFKLMKMDSYRRFVRSPLYQSCSLASVEGRPLPSHPAVHMGSWEDVAATGLSSSNGKMDQSNSSPGKQRRKRGSWGAADMLSAAGGHMSVKSTSSMELGSLYRRTEDGSLSPDSPGSRGGGTSSSTSGARTSPYLWTRMLCVARPAGDLELRVMLTLEKHQLKLQDTLVTMSGSSQALDMATCVYQLANKTLQLHSIKDNDSSRARGSTGTTATQQGTAQRLGQDGRRDGRTAGQTTTRPRQSARPRDVTGRDRSLKHNRPQEAAIAVSDRSLTPTPARERCWSCWATPSAAGWNDSSGLQKGALELTAFLLLHSQHGDATAPDGPHKGPRAPTQQPPAPTPPSSPSPPPARPDAPASGSPAGRRHRGPRRGAERGRRRPETTPKSLKETSI
ncbi:unnamed protein product [Boreogadus saida]